MKSWKGKRENRTKQRSNNNRPPLFSHTPLPPSPAIADLVQPCQFLVEPGNDFPQCSWLAASAVAAADWGLVWPRELMEGGWSLLLMDRLSPSSSGCGHVLPVEEGTLVAGLDKWMVQRLRMLNGEGSLLLVLLEQLIVIVVAWLSVVRSVPVGAVEIHRVGYL